MRDINRVLVKATEAYHDGEKAKERYQERTWEFMEELEAGMVFYVQCNAEDEFVVIRSFEYDTEDDSDFVEANFITMSKDGSKVYDSGYDQYMPEHFVHLMQGHSYIGKLSLEQIKKLDLELRRRREELIREFCRDNLVGIAEA